MFGTEELMHRKMAPSTAMSFIMFSLVSASRYSTCSLAENPQEREIYTENAKLHNLWRTFFPFPPKIHEEAKRFLFPLSITIMVSFPSSFFHCFGKLRLKRIFGNVINVIMRSQLVHNEDIEHAT